MNVKAKCVHVTHCTAHTFDFAGVHLFDSSSVVILLCRPLIDIQSCMGGTSVQHNPILEWRQKEEFLFSAQGHLHRKSPIQKYSLNSLMIVQYSSQTNFHRTISEMFIYADRKRLV